MSKRSMTSPGRNRVFFFVASSGGLPPNETTFARSLQLANYSTALFGKWHLGKDCHRRDDNCHHPNKHGFHYFFGLPLTNLKDFGHDGESVILSYYPNFYLFMSGTAILGVAIGVVLRLRHWNLTSVAIIALFLLVPLAVVLFQKNITTLNSVLYRNERLIEQPVRLETFTERLVNETCHFIRDNHRAHRPFLAMVNFLKVHTAHFPSSQFVGKSAFGKYGDSVLELDHAVGQILNVLDQLDIQNDTFTYFSSDNGAHLEEINSKGQREGGSNGILRGGKGHGAMEGGIRVPSFVMWPGVLPARRVVHAPTMQMDILPTIQAIVGEEAPPNRTIDGKDILGLLSGQSELSPHQFMFHYCGTYLHGVRWIEDVDNVWKVYFYTPKYRPNEEKCQFVCMCQEPYVLQHEPPLVYKIGQDLTEKALLDVNQTDYRRVIEAVHKATSKHQAGLWPVPSQFSVSNSMWKPWLQPCCSLPLCRC